MVTIIQQGDEYALPFKIKKDDNVITPSDITDLRIQIADNLKSYLNNEITYNTETQEWNYPLTQEETVVLDGATVPLQIGIKQSGNIYYSQTISAVVGKSIIKEEW